MFPCSKSHVSDMADSGEMPIESNLQRDIKIKQNKITKIITYETS